MCLFDITKKKHERKKEMHERQNGKKWFEELGITVVDNSFNSLFALIFLCLANAKGICQFRAHTTQ